MATAAAKAARERGPHLKGFFDFTASTFKVPA
jgi:hypothetical protein